MGDTITITDANGIVRIVGVMSDPGATPTDVLTIDADEEVSAQAGGGGGLGVWKTYGIDSANQPLDGITLGNGTLAGQWWTPAAVVPDSGTDPFLCVVEIGLTLGTTTTVDGTITPRLPTLVDGSGFDLETTSSDAIGYVLGHTNAGVTLGLAIMGSMIVSTDGTSWDTTHPGTWSANQVLVASFTFQARFTAD